MDKGGVKVDNGAENRHGDTADNNGFHIISQPDNENWCQSCLWQAVQDNEIGLKNIGGTVTPPEQHGDKGAENQNKDKADKGFADGNADMVKETSVSCHLHHYFQNPRWAAENKIVNQMAPNIKIRIKRRMPVINCFCLFFLARNSSRDVLETGYRMVDSDI